MQSRAPTLVIVSGAPGAGKTTLARRLSSDLRLPLLSRGALQEGYDGLCDFAALPEAALRS